MAGGLFFANAGADGGVEDQGEGAGHLVGRTVVASVESVANGGILVIEETVGAIATIVDARLALLNKFPLTAVHIVWQDAFLVIPDGVVEEVAVGAKNRVRDAVDTHVVQVTLLRIGEQTVRFRTVEVEGRSDEIFLT